METKRYYFLEFAKNHPTYHLSVMAKMMMSQNVHISDIFRKHAEKSYPQSPRHILFLMSRNTESLFEPNEGGSTSREIKSSPVKRFPSLSSLKRRILSFDDSAKSANMETESSAHQTVFASPKKKGSSTYSKRKVTSSHDQPLESTDTEGMDVVVSSHTKAVPKLISPIQTAKKDVKPTTDTQESVSPSEKTRIPENPDSECSKKELKRPAVSTKDDEGASNPSKRPKLSESSATDNPKFVTPGQKAETPIHFAKDGKMGKSPTKATKVKDSPSKAENDKMDISPSKTDKMKDSPSKAGDKRNISSSKADKMNISPNKAGKMKDSPSKAGDKRNISPSKANKMKDSPSKGGDKMKISPCKADKMKDSPSEGGKITASSPFKSRLLKEMEILVSSVPRWKYKEGENYRFIELKENPGCSSTDSSTDDERGEIALDNLGDENSRIEDIVKAVEDRIRTDMSLKKPERFFSPSEKKTSDRSPRKSRKSNSPRKDLTKISGFDDPEATCSHPNVLAYLKIRFSKILRHRTKYMKQIGQSLPDFNSDVDVLYYYAKTVSVVVDYITIENKMYFTRDLKILRDDLIKNSTDLSNKLRPLSKTLQSDIAFWAKGLREFKILKKKNKSLLSSGSSSLELLQKYESNLRKIWDRMDRRMFLRNGLTSTLLEMSADYVKLTTDFVKYLIMVEAVRPCLTIPSEGVGEK